MQKLCATLRAPDDSPVVMRIGLHCGPVIAGVVGGNMLRYQCVVVAAPIISLLTPHILLLACPLSHPSAPSLPRCAYFRPILALSAP